MPDADGFALGELPGTNMVEYGVPIRAETFAYVTVPKDLTMPEVRRLEGFLEMLVETLARGRG